MHLLLVDDDPVNLTLIKSILQDAGYSQLHTTRDSREVAKLVRDFQPDAILLDLMMPWFDGYEILQQLRAELPEDEYLPVMVLTADDTEGAKQRALAAGATDFLIKPYDRTECLLRIRNLLTTRRLHLQLARENAMLEERVQQRTAALESTLDELRDAQHQLVQRERLGALGSMVTGVAHDFNNSLALILGYGERLQHECHRLGASGEITDCAHTIVAAALDAAETVARMRGFHRPAEPGEEHRPVLLDQVVTHAINFTKPRWQSESRGKGAPVDCVTEFEPAPPIMGHPAELREMLTNIIFNAIDAMPQGGTILLRTRAETDHVILEVRDSGTGMSEEVKRRCFEPFFSTKGERGSGLGLSMVYGTVERHGATMAVESILGHGTTFTFSFPVAHGAVLPERAEETPTAARPLRVLVVDDQPVLADIQAETL
jgi:signal transduction histidine kinase